MAGGIALKVKLEGVKEVIAELGPEKGYRAARLALNDSAKAFRTAAGREIRAKFNIRAADLNRKLRVIRLAAVSDLSAEVSAKGRPVSLTDFKVTAVAKTPKGLQVTRRVKGQYQTETRKRTSMDSGVTVEIRKGEKTNLPTAFIARVTAGKSSEYTGVFQRMTRRGRRGKSYLQRIRNKATITVASMLAQEGVLDAGEKAFEEQWPKRLRYHWDRLKG